MANNTPSFDITKIDQQSLKQAFITWLSTQEQFKGYNFAGDSMNVELGLLAYNTWLNLFYQNMAFSESFMDSAQMLSSMYSHAKDLNYLPASATSAAAAIVLTFHSSDPSVILQKGQTFASTIRNDSLVFSVPDNIILTSANGYYQTDLVIKEGSYQDDVYVFNSKDVTQRLVISTANVDISSLIVVVFENGSTTGVPYRYATTLLGLNELNKVYFVQMSETGQYEVLFGDGVVGYKPSDGSVIQLDYRVTIGTAGNGAEVFNINFNPGGHASQINVSTVGVANSGSDAETIESIRFHGPRHFETQERAVADQDYVELLQEAFPEIVGVSVYGGETLAPPQFHKVVIALQLQGIDGLPTSKQDAYYTFTKPRCPKTIEPVFVVADFVYVQINSNITYNVNLTTLTPDNIEALVVNQVQNFAANTLDSFGATLRASPFGTTVDNTDRSIMGNDTDLLIYKKFNPIIGGAPQAISIDFKMPLFEGYPESGQTYPADEKFTISSSPFYLKNQLVTLSDDGAGHMRIIRQIGNTAVALKDVGTVDYAKGKVSLTNLSMDFYVGTWLKIFAKAAGKDIVAATSTVLQVESDAINVTINAVSE